MPRNSLVAAPVVFAALVAVLVGVSSAVSPPALATKEYARKEKKDCSFCHINDKGAGARNAKGKEYEANGYQFGVKSWSSDAHFDTYLRANAAYAATWYRESLRLLDQLEKAEELPGGKALVEGRKARMKIFPKTWLRSGKKLLDMGKRGLPNALNKFLVRLESQFPETDEGKEAVKLLDELAKADATKKAVEEARANEALRVTYLEARTELGLGATAAGKKLLEGLRAKTLPDDLKKSVDETWAELTTSAD